MVIFGLIVAGALAAVAYSLFQMKDDRELIDATAKPVSFKEMKTEKLSEESKSEPSFPALKEIPNKLKLDFNILKKSAGLKFPSVPVSPMDAAEGKKNLLSSVLNVFKFRKKEEFDFDIPNPTPIGGLKEALELEKILKDKQAAKVKTPLKPNAPTGTASIVAQTPVQENKVEEKKSNSILSQDEEKKLESELNASLQLAEMKEKYEKLDKMFTEKSSQIEHFQQSLDSELKNKKEFNKVKDLLEKELKDQKDKNGIIRADMAAVLTESDGHKKRIEQLEQKIPSLEKEILNKEKEIDELVKKIQIFASAKPAAIKCEGVEVPPVFQASVESTAPVAEAIVEPKIEVKEEPPVVPVIPAPEPEPVKEEGSAPAVISESAPVVQAPLSVPEELRLQDEPQEDFVKLQPDVLSVPQPEEPLSAAPENTTQPRTSEQQPLAADSNPVQETPKSPEDNQGNPQAQQP